MFNLLPSPSTNHLQPKVILVNNGVNGQFPAAPTIDEWRTAWTIWDLITQEMMPPSMLYDSDHMYLLHLVHEFTFLSISLSKLRGEPYTVLVESPVSPQLQILLCH